MIVVADTSPICYLLLIGEIDLLNRLYEQVLIPQAVQYELSNEKAPNVVRDWINQPPQWLVVQPVDVPSENDLNDLDIGERAAITLAEQHGADLIVIDDLAGRKIAKSRKLIVTGVLGILDEAARQNLVNFPEAIARLQQTTFRASSKLIQSLLQQYQQKD